MNIFDLFKKAPATNNTDNCSNKQQLQPEIKKVERIPGKRNVFNLIILDESGSMKRIYRPALDGLNETLQTIRIAQNESSEQAHYVSLMVFDTRGFKMLYDVTPIGETTDLTEQQYDPYGGTPLYDAMGHAIHNLRTQVEKDDIVLVSIITDGYENASHLFSGADIKALVETMREAGWVFTYIGANQNVECVAESMSINNRISFQASAEGTNEMFEREKTARRKFYKKIHPDSCHGDISDEYFN